MHPEDWGTDGGGKKDGGWGNMSLFWEYSFSDGLCRLDLFLNQNVKCEDS